MYKLQICIEVVSSTSLTEIELAPILRVLSVALGKSQKHFARLEIKRREMRTTPAGMSYNCLLIYCFK